MKTLSREVPAAVPVPPRFRSLRRSLLAAAAVVVFVATLRGWWGWEAQRRIERVVGDVRARGEPIRVEDYPPAAPEVLGQPDNAASDLVAAAAAVRQGRFTRVDLEDARLPFGDVDRAELTPHLAANAAAIARAKAALDKPRTAWGEALRRPVINMLLRELSGQRDLNRVLALAALAAHDAGDHGEAFRLVRAMLRQADAVETYVPFPVVHLVAASLGTGTADVLRQLVHRLGPADGARAGAARREAPLLIAELLDERAAAAGLLASAYGQRTMTLDNYESKLRPFHKPGYRVFLEPAFGLDAARAVRSLEADVAAARAADYPTAAALLPPERTGERGRQRAWLGATTHVMSDAQFAGGGPTGRWLRVHFQWVLDRRAGAARLAVRLYALDHGGELPLSLDALVPRYLPAVPRDPFAPGGLAPLRFRRDGGPPAVYSVGVNGVDDNGVHTAMREDGRYRALSPDRWPDIVYDVHLPPPPPVPDPRREWRRPQTR